MTLIIFDWELVQKDWYRFNSNNLAAAHIRHYDKCYQAYVWLINDLAPRYIKIFDSLEEAKDWADINLIELGYRIVSDKLKTMI